MPCSTSNKQLQNHRKKNDEMNGNIELLASMLPEKADAALIISNQNRRYFTDFISSLGYLFVTRTEAYLLVDFRYFEAAQKKARNCKVISFSNLGNTLGELIKKHSVAKILLEGSAFTLNQAETIDKLLHAAGAESIKSSELDIFINKMRIIKTEPEIENIIRAQRITEQALKDTLKLIKEGVREKDLALELEYRMKKAGAEDISFDLIVIAGEKTSMPHGVPGENQIKAGDLITFDIGALYHGYHSDMTRTYAFGKVSEKQKKVYQTVLEAQLRGLAAVHEGVLCSEVDEAARSYIYQAGYEGFFGHSTGHGVGLDIHESPSVSPKNDEKLKSGMIITVEPGIYLPGEFGVRIEDMVLVTASGCMNLAALSKELIIL